MPPSNRSSSTLSSRSGARAINASVAAATTISQLSCRAASRWGTERGASRGASARTAASRTRSDGFVNRVHQRVHRVRGTQYAQGPDGGGADHGLAAVVIVVIFALTVGPARGGNERRDCGGISQPFQRHGRRGAQVGIPFLNQRLA